MPSSDAWRRQFPTSALLDVADALAELVADRVAERLATVMAEPTVRQEAFSTKEAAVFLGVSESHVRRLITAGELAPVRLGGRITVSRSELERAVAGGQVAS